MKIFDTERLNIRALKYDDEKYFIELLSSSEIIKPIPQPELELDDILKKFHTYLKNSGEILENTRCVWGIYEKDKSELIGLCLFLTNNEDDRELGYRFRSKYWRKGYGTEVTKGIIEFAFEELNLEIITADVNIENINSVKILDKFLRPVKEFYNKIDDCTDRRYEIKRDNWLQ
jgi:ribosomal-protein-alanine N-acetyltransferase